MEAVLLLTILAGLMFLSRQLIATVVRFTSRLLPSPETVDPPAPMPITLTKSQLNTQALLRWQDSFDSLEARTNGTSRSGRSQEGKGF